MFDKLAWNLIKCSLHSWGLSAPWEFSVMPSKRTILRVQFRTGQTETLLTMITAKERSDSMSLSAPLFSAEWLWRSSLYTASGEKKERGEENNDFNVNKARYPTLGGMGSSSALLTATVLRRNCGVNRVAIWREASGGARRSGTPRVILAQMWGVGSHRRLLAFSWKECSFS